MLRSPTNSMNAMVHKKFGMKNLIMIYFFIKYTDIKQYHTFDK